MEAIGMIVVFIVCAVIMWFAVTKADVFFNIITFEEETDDSCEKIELCYNQQNDIKEQKDLEKRAG